MTIFELRSTEDLMKIVSCGGGIKIEGNKRSTEDLMRIASCAKATGSRLTFTKMSFKSTDDLMKIASCAPGRVSFESD